MSDAERGYTLIDFAPPLLRIGQVDDAVIRFMEYVRQHFHEIVPGVPAESEVDLFASGSPHNPGLLPFIGVHSPRHVQASEPDWRDMIECVQRWSDSLSDEQFREILRTTTAPTWAALQAIGVHPQRGQ